ncbi:hypothetical protein [Flavobacterium sp.]|uniref:hypothetical protein n=1 Tax=Flavobacterium sp. TaxID=239 RepID=UPI0037537365
MQKIIVFVLFFILHFQEANCQKTTDSSIYNWFDDQIGRQNLDINNGRIFKDIYPTVNNSSRYLENENYIVGEIEFDNQYYNNIYINYDLLKDELLLKPNGIKDRNSLIIIKDKIKSFLINDKKFVNLNYDKSINSIGLIGYYEEIISSNFISFYVKHLKNLRNVYVENKIYYEYNLSNEFYIFYKNNFHKLDSKKSIQKLFPEYKSEINKFYQEKKQLENDNKVLFIKTLLNYLNGLQ